MNDGLTARIIGICGTNETESTASASPRVTSILGVHPGSPLLCERVDFFPAEPCRTMRVIQAERPEEARKFHPQAPPCPPGTIQAAYRAATARPRRRARKAPRPRRRTSQPLSRSRATQPICGSPKRASEPPSAESPRRYAGLPDCGILSATAVSV